MVPKLAGTSALFRQDKMIIKWISIINKKCNKDSLMKGLFGIFKYTLNNHKPRVPSMTHKLLLVK